MRIPAQYRDQQVWVMSGDGGRAQEEQFWGYQESVHAQYQEMVVCIGMRGVRTYLDGGG